MFRSKESYRTEINVLEMFEHLDIKLNDDQIKIAQGKPTDPSPSDGAY